MKVVMLDTCIPSVIPDSRVGQGMVHLLKHAVKQVDP